MIKPGEIQNKARQLSNLPVFEQVERETMRNIKKLSFKSE